MDQSRSWQETWHCPCARNRSEKDSTRGRTLYPRTASVRYDGDGGADFVDGGRIQRREVVGSDKMIRRPEEAEQDTRGLREFEEISKVSPVGIYIPTLSV